MSALVRPWTARILQLVDEGVTDRETIILATMAFVPQGHAYRVREYESARSLERARAAGIPEGKRRKPTASQVHRTGARRVVVHTLASLCRCGRLVRDGNQYRRPTMKQAQCAKCGHPITVPDTFDLFEDMEVCPDCEHQMLYEHDEGARE